MARFCVDFETLSFTARYVRKVSTSGSSNINGVLIATEANESPYPVQVGTFGTYRVMFESKDIAYTVIKLSGFSSPRSRFYIRLSILMVRREDTEEHEGDSMKQWLVLGLGTSLCLGGLHAGAEPEMQKSTPFVFGPVTPVPTQDVAMVQSEFRHRLKADQEVRMNPAKRAGMGKVDKDNTVWLKTVTRKWGAGLTRTALGLKPPTPRFSSFSTAGIFHS